MVNLKNVVESPKTTLSRTNGGGLLFLAVCFWLLFLAPAAVQGQSVNGTIRGRVQDESGGVLVGAQVTVRDTEKGIEYPTQTDSLGLYQLTLPVGRYEVNVSASSFAPAKRMGLIVSVGETIPVDFTLQIGGLEQSMEVRAPLPLVNTASGTISALVDRERLAELPLNGRDFGYLALLQPGVVPNNNGTFQPYGGKWANFLINGQFEQATLFLMDGSEINDASAGRTPSGSSGLLLGLEGVQEFEVLLNNYKAEFGKNSGGVIHVVTRSGSNQLHGSVFEYLRNSVLDANDFFLNAANQEKSQFKRNQFGASLGGPIRKDHTFFFLNYEGLRERKGITAVATVPSKQVRSSAVPAVGPFLNLYPLPNDPVNPSNLTSNIIQPTREDFGLGRVDHRWGGRTTLFARFSIQDSLATPPFPSTPVPGFPQDLPHRNTFSTLGATSTLGVNAVNEFRFSFNRTLEGVELPLPPSGLTITPIPGRYFGLITVSGLSNLGTQVFVSRAATNLFEVVENISHRQGRHSQKYGVTIQRYQANELRPPFFGGQYVFAGVGQFLTGTPASWTGVLGGTTASGPASPAGWRWISYSAFAQDDFAIRPTLTLNLGIRYEFSTSPSEVNGHMANLRSPLDPQITYEGPLFNTIARSWGPRFGFAWSPFASALSVLRGGYGIFFNPLVVNMWGNSILVPPFVNTVQIGPPATSPPPFPNPLARGQTPQAVTTGQSIEYRLSQPYAQQWNLEWQQQLFSDWVLKLAYVGDRGVHLLRSLEANPANPVVSANGQKFFPAGLPRRNRNFGPIRGRSSDGMSWYNALQLSLQKRFSKGWTFQSSYTWSKSLSTSTSSFNAFTSQPSNTQDPDDPFLDKGLAPFDVRHRLVFHLIYQLPWQGQFAAGRWLLGGWRVAGIGSFSSGYPFSVVDGINRSQNLQTPPGLADRPNWNPNFRGNPIEGVTADCAGVAAGQKLGGPNRYFDPCAFELQPAGFYGNVPRSALIGPRFANFDLSLSKEFLVREPRALEFRADFFNLFNHPNFATPSNPAAPQTGGGMTVFPDATGRRAGNAGQIFRTVTDSRQIQFSLRYRF